jgi:hypothetical protein
MINGRVLGCRESSEQTSLVAAKGVFRVYMEHRDELEEART